MKKRNKVTDEFLDVLVAGGVFILELRECVVKSRDGASAFSFEALSDRTRKRRSSTVALSEEVDNDGKLKEIATRFHAATERAPLVRYLCSSEIEEALSDARTREMVASSIEELRRAARELRQNGTTESVVVLASAVERGRRHGLDRHESPRVVAHFTRCERLLVDSTSTLEILRRGIRRRNRSDMKEGIERASRIGLKCTEVEVARKKLMSL